MTTNYRDLVRGTLRNIDDVRATLGKELILADSCDRAIGRVVFTLNICTEASEYQSLTEELLALEKNSDRLRKSIVALTREIGLLEHKATFPN